MNTENNTIHEFEINLICEYFSSLERQGPGSPEVTVKALSFIDKLTPESQIADIGCGTGGQTMVLAQHTPGQITGIDLFPTFIDLFNANASNKKLQNRVQGIVGSMQDLPFQNEDLNLIWSEGAIYNIGFERGLTEWRKFLKTNGYIAVTEASWFTDKRPHEINSFWQNAYPEIDTIPNKLAKLQKCGYIPIATFILPEYCWTDNFYVPQIKAQEIFLKKYKDNQTAKEFVAYQRYEAMMYSKFKEYYGYVFYVGKKV